MAKEPKPPKLYPLGIVGESKYQAAVKATDIGDYVDIVIEEGNPHAEDGIALRVDNMDKDTIGYIANDSWLRRAILEEGNGCLARVLSKSGKPTGIAIEIQLGPEILPRVNFGERLPPDQKGTGCVAFFAVFTAIGAFAWRLSDLA